MRGLLVGISFGVVRLLAQQDPPAPSPTPPAPAPAAAPAAPAHAAPKTGAFQLVDRVVATVNDSAILFSEVLTNSAGQIRQSEARLERPLTTNERREIYHARLVPLIDDHALAQAAKTFGIYPPEVVEQMFQEEVKRDEEEQIRDFGTVVDYSKELQRSGRTWQTHLREQRVEKMRDLAEEFAVDERLARQGSLFFTPRALREVYAEMQPHFVHGARASVTMLTFTGPNAQETAAAAAQLWQKENLTGTEVVARCPGATGISSEIPLLNEKSRETLEQAVVDPALEGPAGRVTAPFPLGRSWRVMRIQTYDPPRNGRFEDADVQNELRLLVRRKVRDTLRSQAVERARDRTEFWIHEDLR